MDTKRTDTDTFREENLHKASRLLKRSRQNLRVWQFLASFIPLLGIFGLVYLCKVSDIGFYHVTTSKQIQRYTPFLEKATARVEDGQFPFNDEVESPKDFFQNNRIPRGPTFDRILGLVLAGELMSPNPEQAEILEQNRDWLHVSHQRNSGFPSVVILLLGAFALILFIGVTYSGVIPFYRSRIVEEQNSVDYWKKTVAQSHSLI